VDKRFCLHSILNIDDDLVGSSTTVVLNDRPTGGAIFGLTASLLVNFTVDSHGGPLAVKHLTVSSVA